MCQPRGMPGGPHTPFTPLPLSSQGHLQRLCTQLEQYFGSGLREAMGQFSRSQLKNLATVLYVKWHELLE